MLKIGSIVILNDLIGTLLSTDEEKAVIRDMYGDEHTVTTEGIEEVINPHALALLVYNKLLRRAGH